MDKLVHAQGALIDLAIRFGPRALVAVLTLVAGGFVARWIGRAGERGLARLELEPPVRKLLLRIVRLVVIGGFAILALANLGVDLLPLIAGLSVVGAGIALATQGVLSNAVAGLTIIFTKPYRIGDFIAVAGVEGRVEEISIFNTTLLHTDRSRVVVPNRKIVGEILHNYGKIRQTRVSVAVAFEADLVGALRTIREAVASNQRVLEEPKALIQVAEAAASGFRIDVRPWVSVADHGLIEGELYLAIGGALRAQGLAIGYPQLELRVPGRRTDAATGALND
jgi:small conductance mechanosensitive channel